MLRRAFIVTIVVAAMFAGVKAQSPEQQKLLAAIQA